MDITKKQKSELTKLARKYKLRLILLFGSEASGKVNAKSDLDIAILSREHINYDKETKINNKLTLIFHKNIDLNIIDCVNPIILHKINKNSALLCGRQKDFDYFRSRAFHFYNDYQYFLDSIKNNGRKENF